MKNTHTIFYAALLVMACLYQPVVLTQDNTPQEEIQKIVNELVKKISDDLEKLSDETKKELDTVFNEAIIDIENSSNTIKSFKEWLDYLSEDVVSKFEENAQKKIDSFRYKAKYLPLVELIEQYDIYVSDEIDMISEKLDIYKETLKDEIFKITDEYIEKVDLREMVYEEQMGKLGNITWQEKLKDLKDQSKGAWQSIKDFTVSEVKSFIATAKQTADKGLETAVTETVQKTTRAISQQAINLGEQKINNIKDALGEVTTPLDPTEVLTEKKESIPGE